ncbi:MAG: glycosyltransferase [Mesorhizobium sp.]|nr:glycosyltransferase [Mesorhizobium sp.]
MNTGPADENRDDRLRTSPEDQVVFSVVLVAYNSADVIRDAIESVPAPHEVIVVDNASTDASREIAAAAGARVLALAENLGFGTACNRGAALARNDTLLFLNPDARLMPGALDALAA